MTKQIKHNPRDIPVCYDNIEFIDANEELGFWFTIHKCVHKGTNIPVLLYRVDNFVHNKKYWLRMLWIWQGLNTNNYCIAKLYHVHVIEYVTYFAVEYTETDLQKLVHEKKPEVNYVRHLAYKILCILNDAHSSGVILNRIWPRILVMNEGSLKMAMLYGAIPSRQQVALSSTKKKERSFACPIDILYQSPERLTNVADDQLTSASDMWAFGCVLEEMLYGSPPFSNHYYTSYDHYGNQLKDISHVLGLPTEQDKRDIEPQTDALDKIPLEPPNDIRHLYSVSDEALDLVKKCHQWSPKNRITAEEALKHPFVAKYSNPETERKIQQKIVFPFTETQLSDENFLDVTLRELIAKINDSTLEPISTTAILSHNIARSSVALQIFPTEVWLLIFKMLDELSDIKLHEKTATRVFKLYFSANKK